MNRMRKAKSAAIATLGIDIGKNVFHLIGLDKRGAIVLRLRLSRGQVEARLANMPRCLVGMEACVGAHHLGRQLRALGPRRPADGRDVRSAVFERAEERLPRCRGDR